MHLHGECLRLRARKSVDPERIIIRLLLRRGIPRPLAQMTETAGDEQPREQGVNSNGPTEVLRQAEGTVIIDRYPHVPDCST